MSGLRLASCLVVLTTVIASLVQADEPVKLGYKFASDRPLIYRTKLVTEQVQTVGDQKIETKTEHSDVTVRTFESVDDDGNIRLKSQNKQIQVKVKIGASGDYAFDSKSTEREKGSALGAALTPLYERLSGAELTLVVTPLGKVADVKGYEELVGDILKDNPMAGQFAAGGSKQAAKLAYQDALDQFSPDPVKVGDKWEIPYEVEIPKLGKAQGKRIYTVEAADKVGSRDTVRIGVALELAFDIDLDVNGAKVTGKLSTTEANGTLQFDPQLGQIVSKKSRYKISGDLSVDVAGNILAVRSEQTQTVEFELLDKLPE